MIVTKKNTNTFLVSYIRQHLLSDEALVITLQCIYHMHKKT